MINPNLVKLTMIARLVLFPILTLIHANEGVEPTISKAVLTAQSENRQLMLFFTSQSCQRCKQLEGQLHTAEKDVSFNNRYVAVVVDINDFDGRACRQVYGIDQVPAVIVVNPDGSVHVKAEGEITDVDFTSILENSNIEHLQAAMHESAKSKTRATGTTEPGAYALQLGFLSSETNAKQLKNKVEDAGYKTVFVDVEDRNNKPHYRVLLGGYDNENDAISDKNNLVASGFEVKIHKLSH